MHPLVSLELLGESLIHLGDLSFLLVLRENLGVFPCVELATDVVEDNVCLEISVRLSDLRATQRTLFSVLYQVLKQAHMTEPSSRSTKQEYLRVTTS